MNLPEAVAVWGATLSTLLAILRVWEFWKSRVTVEVTYNFRSSPELGNDIIIRNLSAKPIMITHWELLFLRRRWPILKAEARQTPSEHFEDIHVSAHSSCKLEFRYGEYFATSGPMLDGISLYLRLHLAGKTLPITKFVYRSPG